MGLKERINDEMVADTESFLEEYFDQASELFRIFENGNVVLKDEFEDAPWRERVLIHLIGQRYAYEGEKAEKPTLPYGYFYTRLEVDDSTVRAYMNELNDDLLVEKDEESNEWKIIPNNLPNALSRIEGVE